MYVHTQVSAELLASCPAPDNGDARRPIQPLRRRLPGKRFGERGYSSQTPDNHLFIGHGLVLIQN